MTNETRQPERTSSAARQPTNMDGRSRGRSARVTRNVLVSLVVKGGGALISYLVVPVALTILNQGDYGVWLTLSSLVTWITFFDLGLNNGLRNRLAEALARGDLNLGRRLVSTTFMVIAAVVLGVFLIYLAGSSFLNWASILNESPARADELRRMATAVVGAFSLTLILNIAGVVFMASQRPAYNDVVVFGGQLLGFALLLLIGRLHGSSGSLTTVALILAYSPAAAMAVAFVLAFASKYRDVRPGFRYFDWSLTRSIMGLGTRFFLVRLASLAIFSLSMVVVTQVVGPEGAAEFGIARKYFRIVSIVATIVTTPVWAATTDAFVTGDIPWVRRIARRLLLLFGLATVLIVLMVFASGWVYKIWLGDAITITLPLTIAFALFAALDAWNSVFAFIVAGSGKMHLTSMLGVVSTVVFLPLSILLGRNFGTVGVALAMAAALSFWAVQLPIQTRKLLNGTAAGPWAR